MKYQKTLAVLAGLTFAGALSQAQIAIGENLTVSGFVDASYADTSTGATDNTEINVDEVEIDFAFSYDSVSAEVHLQTNDTDGVDLEQAFVSTDLGGITVSAGRMLNLLGFEADEPTGLLTYSKAYSNNSDDNYNPGSRYNDGIRGAFSQGDLSIAASVTDDYSSDTGALNDADELAFDIALTYAGIENLSLSLGYADNSGDTALEDLQITNVHATYSLGQLTIGGEYSDWEDGADEADAYLLLANYAVNDDLSLTIRHSEVDVDGGATADREKTTVAAGYTVSDNLSTIIEYSTGETGTVDHDVFAVEGIFTF